MKILIISNLYPPFVLGGYEILCSQVCNDLSERGHDVVILTSAHGFDETDSSYVEPFPNVHRRLKLYIPFSDTPRLFRRKRYFVGKSNYRVTKSFITKENPDLIFVWSQLRLTVGSARAALDSGIPTAFTFNDEHVGEFMPSQFCFEGKAALRYILDNWIMPSITLKSIDLQHTTCISQQLKSNLLKKHMPIENSKVIYQGIPITKFPMKENVGKVHSPARILYVGQLHSYKGVHNVINAVQLVAKEKGAEYLTLSVIGTGSEQYQLELIRLANRGDALVNFVGQVDHSHLPRLYREHDIFVFSSIWQEPFGLTHLEAMASGTPVISTADGGHGEFLLHNHNALVFEKENERELADKIVKLVEDADLRDRLIVTARKIVEEQFTLKAYVNRLEKFLTNVKESGSG